MITGAGGSIGAATAKAFAAAGARRTLRPAGEAGALVVIDWGFGDLLPIGFDLGQLLVGLAPAADRPDELRRLTRDCARYLDGLAEIEGQTSTPGWCGPAISGGLAVRSALCALPFEQLSEHAPSDELLALFANRLRLTRVMVDLARGEPACSTHAYGRVTTFADPPCQGRLVQEPGRGGKPWAPS